MSDTTYEKAKRCPICDTPGERRKTNPIGGGARIETIYCVKEACRWFNTGWAVQINADGSIPELNRNDNKQFQMPKFMENAARREIEETRFVFGLDKETEDPDYGKQRTEEEIRKQF